MSSVLDPPGERLHSAPVKSTFASFLAALAGCAMTWLAFHPGCMSGDSIDQLTQARLGVFHGHHPPVMALVWRWLDGVWPGPAPMLLLQSALFWGGLGLIAALSLPWWLVVPGVLCAGLAPPDFGMIGVIWKDVQMGAALLAAAAVLLHARLRGGRWQVAPVLLLLFYAAAIRGNGPAAALPLFAFGAAIFLPRWRPLRAYAGGVALCLAMAFATSRLNRALTHDETPFPIQQPLLHDLVGLSLREGRSLLPAFEPVPLGRLRELYEPDRSDPLFFSDGGLHFTGRPEEMQALRAAWWTAVRAHPGAYLSARMDVFRGLLGLGSRWRDILHPTVDSNALGVRAAPSAVNRLAVEYLDGASELWFRPYLYLGAMLLLVAALAATGRLRPVTAALAASAFLYTAPYLFVAPTTDFRYVWWPVLASIVLPLVALAEGRAATGAISR